MCRLLINRVESVPVPAEVLYHACRELEPRAELPVLEEYVRVPKAGRVQVLALPFLREDPVDTLDETDLFEGPNLAVARGDGDVVLVADFLDGARAFLCRNENPLRVLVRQETRNVLLPHLSSRFYGDIKALATRLSGMRLRRVAITQSASRPPLARRRRGRTRGCTAPCTASPRTGRSIRPGSPRGRVGTPYLQASDSIR